MDTLPRPALPPAPPTPEVRGPLLRRRLLTALSLVTVASGVGVLATLVDAGAAPATTTGKTYVALGDSYAAGFGLPLPSTPTGQPVPGCEQTTGDYPHILAGQLGLTLTDVACSGATTDDFYSPQSESAGGNAPPQLDIFKTIQPDLVTITIGGNDLGFTSIARACAATAPAAPAAHVYGKGDFAFSTCQDYYDSTAADGGKAANPYDKLAAVIAKVKAAIAAVQQAAPHAKVAVIAYPAIEPDVANTPQGGCYTSLLQTPTATNPYPSALPFTDADVPYLQVLQQKLDAGIGTAAKQLGAAYANIYPSSLSHSACQPENVRWVEPLTPDDGGTNVLHPNLAGTTAMANALNPVVQELFAPSPVPSTTAPSMTPPATTAPASTSASASVLAASGTPLAATGPATPTGPMVLIGTLLVGGGAALLFVSSKTGRRRGAHG